VRSRGCAGLTEHLARCGLDGLYTRYAARTHHVVLDLIDGGVKKPLVVSELLQDPDPATRAEDRHHIALLHLLVDKFLHRPLGVINALPRESQIIGNESESTVDSLGRERERRKWKAAYRL